MNTQRFIWAATTLLFAVAGVMLGLSLGWLYVDVLHRNWIGMPSSVRLAPISLSLGLGVILARIGSSLADRVIGPAVSGLHKLSAADRILGVMGALLGLVFGVLLTTSFIPGTANWLPIKFCIMAVSAAIGMAFFGGMRAEMLRVFPQLEPSESATELGGGITPKFLDTNIIIDGRLADICKTGFIEGPIYIPQFVLEEVQYIADSSDSMRRARGRRGLDVLNEMKELTTSHWVNNQLVLTPVVHVLNDISPEVQRIAAVDSKLVALAKEKHGSIITNDFNLNKVAELQGVQVLNLNELAQSLKPVVLPGEEMQITIVKEGKEPTQGVGYLEDGTMVVVGDGGHHIGETCRVTISSVYQTVAGKMIFAEMRDKDFRSDTRAELRNDGRSEARSEARNENRQDGRQEVRSENRQDARTDARTEVKPSYRNAGDDLFDSNNDKLKDDFGHRSGGGVRRKGRT